MSKPDGQQAAVEGIALLLAARTGDEEAARALVKQFAPAMVRTVRNVLGRYSGTETEDVVQEALIAAFTTSSLPTSDLGAWLRAIAVRKALDWLRQWKRKAEQPFPENGDDVYLSDLHTAAKPDASLQVLIVRQALTRLSPKDRAVLVLVDLEGHSMAEAAAILGCSQIAFKLRASRARRKLAREMQESSTAVRPRTATEPL